MKSTWAEGTGIESQPIQLIPINTIQWDDAQQAGQFIRALRECGFTVVGAFKTNDLIGTELCALVNRDTSVYAVVYEGGMCEGTWFDIMTTTLAGTRLTVTNLEGPLNPSPPGKLVQQVETRDAKAAYEQLLASRPGPPYVKTSADRFVSAFERECAEQMEWGAASGVPLDALIRDLASGDDARRSRAGMAIMNRLHSAEAVAGACDGESALPLSEAIPKIFADPDFPGEEVMRQLIANSIDNDKRNQDAASRGEWPSVSDAAMSADMATEFVIRHAGAGASAATPELLSMLESSSFSGDTAAAALGNMGPEAAAAIEPLLSALFEQDGHPDSQAVAVAAIAGSDPTIIARLSAALSDRKQRTRIGAAVALGYCGARAASATHALIEAADHRDPATRSHAVTALGTVGQGNDEVLELLIRLARDPAPLIRGRAIDALGDVRHVPSRSIPVLIAALTDEEFDIPYEEGCRICDCATVALGKHGSDAAAAVPALLIRFDSDLLDEDLSEIIEVFGAIGPPAAPALGRLQDLLGRSDYYDDELESAIARISGLTG